MGVMYKSGKLYGGINTINVCPVEHRTLLWTNPDQTAVFAPQTIGLDLSDYDEVEIIFRHNSQAFIQLNARAEIGRSGNVFVSRSDTFLTQERQFDVSATGVKFYDCKLGANAQVFNDHSIPYQIYGIKRQNTHMELEQLGIHVSTKEPTVNDGQDGDIWFVYF